MIRKGLKNFFVNLKYYFTPLGVLALGAILGLAIALPVVAQSLKELLEYASSVEGVQLDFAAFLHSILDAVLELDWQNPSKALATLISSEWLNQTFADSIFALVQNAEPVAEQILEKIAASVSSFVVAAVVIIVLAILGVFGGFYVTKYLVRREIARRAFWKFFLVSLADAVITAALPVLVVWLGALWEPSVYLVVLALPLIWSAIALLEAYLVHGVGKLKLKDVITVKSSAMLMLTNFLIILIASAATSVISALFGDLVGLFLGLPLLEIALIVGSLNAESFVKETAELKAEVRPAEA